MTVEEIAQDLVRLVRAGRDDEAGRRYWAPNVRSVEARDDMPVAEGPQALAAKGEWFMDNHEVHDVKVEGPWVNGNRFTARFTYDLTPKATGERTSFDEIALYTVEGEKVVEERFFYGTGG
jgi:ketosteroid isomerase-like protein